MFVDVRMEQSDRPAGYLPFGDKVYIMAALLEPYNCLFWLEHDVPIPDEVKSDAKEMVIGKLTFDKFLNLCIH